jgi:hypothetical protein
LSDESDLFDIYNENRGPLPKAMVLTPERRSKCKTRMESHKAILPLFLDNFRTAVIKASQSSFCCGESGWRANFDWLIANDTNYLKCCEGRYDDGPKVKPGAIPPLDRPSEESCMAHMRREFPELFDENGELRR